MKKQLLLIASFLLISGSIFGQIVLQNVTTQYYSADNTLTVDAHLDVENTNSYPVDIMIIRTIEVLTPGHDELFCFGLYCYLPSTDTSLYTTTIPANSSDASFKPQLMPNGIDGMDRFHYRFYDNNNPADSVSVTIEFFIGTTGVTENANESYLKFKNEVNNFTVFNYKLPASARTARIDIHNMLGSRMNSIQLHEKQGMKMVTTSELSNGMYLVSLVIDNKTTHSYRMIVNHQKGN
jgi:hypothetical protein